MAKSYVLSHPRYLSSPLSHPFLEPCLGSFYPREGYLNLLWASR